MSVMDVFLLNAVIVLGITILVFILAAGERLIAAWFAFLFTLVPSIWAWSGYVAVHFISKYW